MSSVQARIGNAEPAISGGNLLAIMPYGGGFLFIDEFVELDRTHVVARYRFREGEFFYAGHFSDRPITPGVVLLETMCQTGMVAQGLYLLAQETGVENATRYRFLVTSAEVEWLEQVHPGEQVTIRGELLAWRQNRIRTRVNMFNEQGTLVAESKISGMGVVWRPDVSPNDSLSPKSLEGNKQFH
jgi:3-hydroxyacyl-[acyl-carrier-protein] dehydratase